MIRRVANNLDPMLWLSCL